MKSSDIKVGYIYYVDYEPVREGEFNGLHLSVVLKRNSDKYTYVVMPLTSSANGDGVNKVKLGKIAGFPPNLRSKDTYAVYNQVRTVNANRFRPVKSGGSPIDVPVDKSVLSELFILTVRDMLYNIGQDDRLSILHQAYDGERVTKAKDLAYTVIRLRKVGADKEKIFAVKTEIRDILKDAAYTLAEAQKADGIQQIFDEALNLKNDC